VKLLTDIHFTSTVANFKDVLCLIHVVICILLMQYALHKLGFINILCDTMYMFLIICSKISTDVG
jgi:hypothetical protein